MLVLKQEPLLKKYNYYDKDLDKIPTDYFLKSLDQLEDLLSKYLKLEESSLEKDPQCFFEKITADYSASLLSRSLQRISEVKIEKADCVINYNYTKTAETLFEEYSNKSGESHKTTDGFIRYINGALKIKDSLKVKEIKNNIVVGYTNQKNTDVSKDLFPFEKRARRIIKNTDYVNLGKVIDGKEFDLVIMGHSCGVADSDILSKLLSDSNLRSAVILCFSVDQMISIYNNIKSMLKQDTFDELMDHSDFRRNLFFSVRAPQKGEENED